MAKNALQQSILNKASEDKFLLVFDIPPILKSRNRHFNHNNVNFIKESVQFSIAKTTVPEITVPAVEIRDAGSTLYVSSHSKNSYPPVTVEFKIDNEYKNYWTIYKWLNLLHDEKLGHYNADEIVAIHNSMDDYQTDLTIFGMDEFGNPTGIIGDGIWGGCTVDSLLSYVNNENNFVISKSALFSIDCDYPLGDLNADGGLNVLDIISLTNCVLAENCADLENGCAGDLNGDGGYNVLDIVTLANCVLAENCGS